MRKRILAPLALIALLAACGTADDVPQSGPAASPTPAAPSPAAPTTTVGTSEGPLGTFLTDGSGRTLYLFTVDEPGVSNCDADCLSAWPPLLTAGDPAVGGAADPALIGTFVRDDGTVQVTYAGWPLYFFAADAGPGDVNGQGLNDVWFVVAPSGERIGTAPDGDGDTGMGGYGSSDDSDDSGGYGGYGY
jgi:predicted lipoprotein with Yx(FWY)xxD motif